MIEKHSRKIIESPLLDVRSHSRDLLLALSRAAQAIQQAHTAVDFYRAVGDAIKPLGGEVTLLMINEDRQSLSIAYTSYSPTLIRKAEKLTGLSLLEYRIPFSQDSVYGRAVDGGKTVFSDSTSEAIAEILPGILRSFTPLLVKMFKLQQGILAPLRVGDSTLGLLKINGLFLNEDDVPAMDSFAGQIAAGIQNVRLMQKLQDELTAHRQADELLNHNRSLLLALSRAFQTIQQAHTPEDIYCAVGDQIKSLGGEVTLLMVNDDGQSLTAAYTSYAPKLLQQIEKLTGSSVLGYRLVFSPDSIYARNIAAGKAEYVHWVRDYVFEGLPMGLRSLTDQFIKLLKIEQGILAPLQVGGEVLGLMMVSGLSLNEGDVPAMESFAGQIAAGVLNARLTQQMRNELSARKQAEEAVRQAENRFKALIEKASDGIVLVGLDGKIQYASPSARNMFDYDNQADILSNPLTFIHPDDLAIVLNAMNDLIHNPAYIPTLEYRYRYKDGSYHWVESTFSNLLSEPGVQAVVINFRDITERKRIEQALHESEKYYRALIENATDGILVLGMDGKIQYESPSVTRMLGYAPESLIGMSAFDLINPEDLAQIAGAFMEGLSTPGFIHRGEYRLLHHSGEWRCFEIVSHYLMEDPAIAGIIINGRDITERKLFEDALLDSEGKFHSVISESSDGIVLSDEAGHVIEFNNAIEQIIGLKREIVLGQFLWDLQFQIMPRELRTEENYAKLKDSIIKTLETGQSSFLHKMLDAPFQYADGSTRFVQQRVFSVRTEKGWRLGSISRDITDNKRGEEALRASEAKSKSLYQMLRLMTDNLPDLVWAKDMDGCYTFTNKAMIEKLLIAQDTEEPIGKNDLFFAERQRALHPEISDWHTFGEICMDSETSIHTNKRPERFEEFGNIKNKFLFLDVYKAPFWDEYGNMIGTVGIGRDVTHEKEMEEERKQAQKTLAASDAELRALFASMQDAVLVIDRDGVYRKIAPTNPAVYYITPQELIGKNLVDIFPADQAEVYIRVIQRVLETQQTQHIEYELAVNGHVPWFEAFISPMGADQTLWVARDISERKKIETALIQSEQAYRTLFENMPIGLYRTSADGRILDANPALVKMFGYPDSSSLLAMNARDLYADPASNDRFKDEVLNKSVPFAFESEYKRYDHKSFWAEDYVHIIYDKEGSPLYYEGSLINITDRKLAEQALTESEKQYRLLAEGMADVVWVLDVKNMKFKYVSPSVQKLLGYTAEEMLDMSMEELIVSYSMEQINANFPDRLARFIQGDPMVVTEMSTVDQWRKDGSLVSTEIATTLVRNEKMEIEAIGVSRDISERKRAEDELRRANKSLETVHYELKQMFAHEQMLARTDSLTNLYNRRYFFELAVREFTAALRYERPLTIFLFDIDGFKQVNDTFGHAFGDTLLVQVAQTTAAQVRDVDIFARYGGDEFIILLPETNAQQAFMIAERIREHVASTRIETENSPFIVTLSIGVAETIHSPQDESVEDAIRRADKALYMAKQKGRNTTVIFSEP